MQDTLTEKLLPAFLRATGDPIGSAIDNLHRAAAMGILEDPVHWLATRLLRNRLVHEYIEDAQALAQALEQARNESARLHATYLSLRAYCQARPELARPEPETGSRSGPSSGPETVPGHVSD